MEDLLKQLKEVEEKVDRIREQAMLGQIDQCQYSKKLRKFLKEINKLEKQIKKM